LSILEFASIQLVQANGPIVPIMYSFKLHVISRDRSTGKDVYDFWIILQHQMLIHYIGVLPIGQYRMLQ
jgi:hypothetical protein